MQNLSITSAQRALFSLVGHNLFGTPLEIPGDVDWKEVIKESIAQSLPLIAFKNYRELPIDEGTADKLHGLLRRCTASNINSF